MSERNETTAVKILTTKDGWKDGLMKNPYLFFEDLGAIINYEEYTRLENSNYNIAVFLIEQAKEKWQKVINPLKKDHYFHL
ncbi:MAG TPA: hypothetical protein PKN62_03155, partial [bacterium]|nr:hypothetical protein [bacterium]